MLLLFCVGAFLCTCVADLVQCVCIYDIGLLRHRNTLLVDSRAAKHPHFVVNGLLQASCCDCWYCKIQLVYMVCTTCMACMTCMTCMACTP